MAPDPPQDPRQDPPLPPCISRYTVLLGGVQSSGESSAEQCRAVQDTSGCLPVFPSTVWSHFAFLMRLLHTSTDYKCRDTIVSSTALSLPRPQYTFLWVWCGWVWYGVVGVWYGVVGVWYATVCRGIVYIGLNSVIIVIASL